MSKSLDEFNKSLKKLEQLIIHNSASTSFSTSPDDSLKEENLKLKEEIGQLKTKYNELAKTSEKVINELNSSIEVIDNYFKKQDAKNKNT